MQEAIYTAVCSGRSAVFRLGLACPAVDPSIPVTKTRLLHVAVSDGGVHSSPHGYAAGMVLRDSGNAAGGGANIMFHVKYNNQSVSLLARQVCINPACCSLTIKRKNRCCGLHTREHRVIKTVGGHAIGR
jgi:hypothetical protein